MVMKHRNRDMHAVLQTMMEPFYANKIEWRLGTICKAAGIEDMRLLPRCHNNCFRWMLGSCEHREGGEKRCKKKPENSHPKAEHIPDDYACQLAQLLQPGVTKVLSDCTNAGKRQRE